MFKTQFRIYEFTFYINMFLCDFYLFVVNVIWLDFTVKFKQKSQGHVVAVPLSNLLVTLSKDKLRLSHMQTPWESRSKTTLLWHMTFGLDHKCTKVLSVKICSISTSSLIAVLCSAVVNTQESKRVYLW